MSTSPVPCSRTIAATRPSGVRLSRAAIAGSRSVLTATLRFSTPAVQRPDSPRDAAHDPGTGDVPGRPVRYRRPAPHPAQGADARPPDEGPRSSRAAGGAASRREYTTDGSHVQPRQHPVTARPLALLAGPSGGRGPGRGGGAG